MNKSGESRTKDFCDFENREAPAKIGKIDLFSKPGSRLESALNSLKMEIDVDKGSSTSWKSIVTYDQNETF